MSSNTWDRAYSVRHNTGLVARIKSPFIDYQNLFVML